MRFLSIILLCIVAAVLYGVVHDQITARICVEYFTIGHPPVFDTNDPTLLGLGWGVIATWWVGLILGVPLALCSRVGSSPQLSAMRLVRPLAIMLAVVAVLALVAGVVGHVAATRRWVWLLEPMASRVPADRHVAFLTDLWAHLASYIGGFLGGVVLCVYVLVRRARARRSVMSQKVTDDDWRLLGQERYLSAATLFWRAWHETRPGWDHDHCEFCNAKFMDREGVADVLREGYTTDDGYRWVCAGCASDFAERFKFKLVGGPAAT
ncbi:MAG TPA: hypothetical protein VF669_09275 [Tepidisphaeraceae bacterium]